MTHDLQLPDVSRNAPPVRELTDLERSELESAEGRGQIAARYRGHDSIELGNLAILCGDPIRTFGSGPRCRHLIAEVNAGRLRAAGDLRLLKDGKRRTSLVYLPINADAFRAWLGEHGTERERHSAAAEWCNRFPSDR